jgi:two-component system, cell cycle sensor histidine kinase and response regulator CckA
MMSQESISIETTKVNKPLNIIWPGGSLRWKISVAFSGLILLLGVLVIGIVYFMTDNALHRQVDLRAMAIATNLSDASAAYVSRRNTLELDVLIAKYGRLDSVAYAYIQDPKGEIVATSLQPFPAELKDPTAVERRTANSRVTNIRGKSIYDTRVPLLEGQLGTVHVGLWADSVQADVRGTVWTIITLISGCLVLGLVLSLLLAAKAIRPILELKASADEISRGQLDTPVTIQSTDEIGELARSLERMRASLKAAMVRLNRE